MMPKPPVKIAIVSHSLGTGGAERSAALLSRILADDGYDVHNIIITDKVDYPFPGPLLNLGRTRGIPFFRRFAKAFRLFGYIRKHQIDVVIDHRARGGFLRELMFRWAYGRTKKIYVVHSRRLASYFPRRKWQVAALYSDAALVAVSQSIADAVRNDYGLGATVVYNPAVPFPQVSDPPPEGNYILYFGRLDDEVKNFRLMIDAFARSAISENGYRLLIMGAGPDAERISGYASEFGVPGLVEVMPFNPNPSQIIRKARFCVLTSRFEGFPMSLVESLMVGTPVVSVDCDSGPSEIIRHRQNGLLVENHHPEKLAESFKMFVNDADLYQICKSNSAPSVSHLSVDYMLKQWKQILPSPERGPH